MGLASAPRLLGYTDDLAVLADRLDVALQTPIHQVYLPVGYLGLLHAIRVSHATRQVGGGLGSKLNLYQSVLLNQILLFGGVALSSLLLGLPCPMLASGQVILLYAGTHVALTLSGIGTALLKLNDNWTMGVAMDIFFSALDGIFRADGVLALGVDIVRTHPSALISTSYLASIVNGAIVGGATPLIIDVLRLDSASGDWTVRTPRWIKDPWAGTQDLLSAAMVSTAYLACIDGGFAASTNPFLGPLADAVSFNLGSGVTAREARTMSMVLMSSILVAQRLAAIPSELNTAPRAPAKKPSPSKAPRISNGSADAGLAVPQIAAADGSASPTRKSKKAAKAK
ncbi:uncharacterized protein PFL1_02968 [Pseudozyma flocculosa PF-1]|uniref:Uncharacterized protein n=2 Tax=Pseudozyma flocculosa TaxID=84751 RepID=A0A5C3F524_9BASI|nr:uncharacterized protein PFL1_02968 [Pseudozyma flocculosa PF-1]EPQ29749.1 hypothetical protein PFL1_02968 [Pseudozyma flocculosa PF-1]SPO38331.1 uncharacterized protein PSFLO_03808 [Pseudozyma flocculosa]